MGFEKPNASNDNFEKKGELDTLLAKIAQHIEDRANDYESITTPGGFSGTLTKENDQPIHLILEHNSLTSIFFVNGPKDPYLSELRDVDGGHVDDPKVQQQHRNEAIAFLTEYFSTSQEKAQLDEEEKEQLDLPLDN